MNLNREININKLYQIGDIVDLPFNERGIIKEILDIPWGFSHIVEISEGTFNEVGDLVKYKPEQFG